MFKKYGLPGRGKYWCPPPFILLHNRSFQGGTISRTYLHDKIILIMHGTNENKYKTKQNRGATLFPTLDNTLQGGGIRTPTRISMGTRLSGKRMPYFIVAPLWLSSGGSMSVAAFLNHPDGFLGLHVGSCWLMLALVGIMLAQGGAQDRWPQDARNAPQRRPKYPKMSPK